MRDFCRTLVRPVSNRERATAAGAGIERELPGKWRSEVTLKGMHECPKAHARHLLNAKDNHTECRRLATVSDLAKERRKIAEPSRCIWKGQVQVVLF